MTTIVDGFPVPVNRPGSVNDFHNSMYSGLLPSKFLSFSAGKEKQCVIRYHLAVTASTGDIVDLHGFKGASNDLNVIRDSGFLENRDANEWTLGDGIYSCTFALLLFSE